jgi:hypothetical protein
MVQLNLCHSRIDQTFCTNSLPSPLTSDSQPQTFKTLGTISAPPTWVLDFRDNSQSRKQRFHPRTTIWGLSLKTQPATFPLYVQDRVKEKHLQTVNS